MTFEEYIKNPQGKGSAMMSNRQLYKELYETKFNNILLRENGNIIYTMYQDNKEVFYIHIKIPSEVVPKFYYDTVIRFYHSKQTGVIESKLNNYDVQFYSNDPSFVFTFAHAFKKNGMFIKDLEYKMGHLALKEVAHEKNPNSQIGYVKSLYFAYLVMKRDGLFNKQKWEIPQKPYNKKVWNNTITHADDKVKDRQEKGAALVKKENKRKSQPTFTAHHRKPPYNKHVSPNIKDFGHFKKQDFNPIQTASKNLNRIVSNIKKSFR